MHELISDIVRDAAEAAGLPEDHVFDQSKKDNLTQPRPRIELQFLPERLVRTGRILASTRTSTEQRTKRELYEVELTVLANVLAEDEQWLGDFCYDFVAALPRGINDKRGNWVKIRVMKAEFGRKAPPRVGTTTIQVFTKVSQMLSLTCTYRITRTDVVDLIRTFTIKEPIMGG
ncbi:MAG: translation initiation factor 2 [Desulfovibrionaceae bacterium]|nr:translation initiation factor 2 [Desulfovibrionaceae bacterium]